jgi:hypothetical protein
MQYRLLNFGFVVRFLALLKENKKQWQVRLPAGQINGVQEALVPWKKTITRPSKIPATRRSQMAKGD